MRPNGKSHKRMGITGCRSKCQGADRCKIMLVSEDKQVRNKKTSSTDNSLNMSSPNNLFDDDYSNRSLLRLSDFSSSCRSSSKVVLSFSRSFRANSAQFCIGMILEDVEQLRVGFPRSGPWARPAHGAQLVNVLFQNFDFVRSTVQ